MPSYPLLTSLLTGEFEIRVSPVWPIGATAAAAAAWQFVPPGSTALGAAALLGFAVVVALLSFTMLRLCLAGSLSAKAVDRVLLGTFAMFLFVAWFFEPAVIFLCGWEGLGKSACNATLIGRLWHFYAVSFDPVFLNLPLWLRIVCSLDTLLFGPFYAISLYAFGTGRQLARWYVAIALPFSGALLYSTVVYFA